MAYPTVPDLQPFAGNVTPDLRANGPYDTTLTQIENYLKQLGAYVDAQIAEVRGEIPSSTDFATYEQLEQAKTDVTELGNEVNTLDGTVSEINTKINNILNISYYLPGKITSDNEASRTTGGVFFPDGTSDFFKENLFNVLGNLMLAAANGDHT